VRPQTIQETTAAKESPVSYARLHGLMLSEAYR
jgi:hypothetical protein